MPRIAGKPAGYLFQQLLAFRDGRRHHVGMARLLENLGDDYLRALATHFSALSVAYEPATPARAEASALQRGQSLVRDGDRQRNIPACSACHGPALMGVAPAVPGLLGLPRGYLTAQLGAWQAGTRQAVAPDCMATIARRLRQEDVAALADWLVRQPIPQPATPGASAPGDLPLRCGSVAP